MKLGWPLHQASLSVRCLFKSRRVCRMARCRGRMLHLITQPIPICLELGLFSQVYETGLIIKICDVTRGRPDRRKSQTSPTGRKLLAIEVMVFPWALNGLATTSRYSGMQHPDGEEISVSRDVYFPWGMALRLKQDCIFSIFLVSNQQFSTLASADVTPGEGGLRKAQSEWRIVCTRRK